jgi:hypothetical protein
MLKIEDEKRESFAGKPFVYSTRFLLPNIIRNSPAVLIRVS